MSNQSNKNAGSGCIIDVMVRAAFVGLLALCPTILKACDQPILKLFSRGSSEAVQVIGDDVIRQPVKVGLKEGVGESVESFVEKGGAEFIEEGVETVGDELGRMGAVEIGEQSVAQISEPVFKFGSNEVTEEGISALRPKKLALLIATQLNEAGPTGLKIPLEKTTHTVNTIIKMPDESHLLKINDEWLLVRGNQVKTISNVRDVFESPFVQDSYLLVGASDDTSVGISQIMSRSAIDEDKLVETTVRIGDEDMPVFYDPITENYYVNMENIPATKQSKMGELVEEIKNFDFDSIEAMSKFASETNITTRITTADELLDSGKFQEAINYLDDLILEYGEQPDFTTRKALAQIFVEEERRVVAATLNATEVRSLHNAHAVVDEINERFSNEILSEADAAALHRVAEFTDWTDHLGRNPELSGKPKIDVEDGAMVLAFQTDDSLGHTVKTQLDEVLENENTAVYVDTASLNNWDWNVSFENALANLPEGELPSAFQLTRQDIAHFNPATIYVSDQTTLRRARRPAVELKNQPSGQLARLYQSYESSQDDDNEENKIIVLTLEAPDNLSVGDVESNGEIK